MPTPWPTIEFTSESVAQTLSLGRRLAGALRGGDVVALSGTLGAGKTQLVRGIAEGLGVDGRTVSSPTFVLMCEYEPQRGSGAAAAPATTPATAPGTVVHIDAYRMQSLADLESIGWDQEMFENAVTLVEWADRIAGQLPPDHLWVTLEHAGEERRRITLQPRGGVGRRIKAIREAVEATAGGAASKCPSCGQPVATSVENYPFCSSRCKLADLNKWFNGGYRIGTPLHDVDDASELE